MFVLIPGGSARDTKRMKAVKNAVKHGQNKAEIRIWLHNGRSDEAHRPDLYGDSIIFERHIYAESGNSKHFIKDSSGRTVFEDSELFLENFNFLKSKSE